MEWKQLNSTSQLNTIREESFKRPQVIFKHSTRCSISSMVLSRLDRTSSEPDGVDFYHLDLIAHRDISNLIAELWDVWHESPQILLIKNGECIYDESHMGINMADILEQATIAA